MYTMPGLFEVGGLPWRPFGFEIYSLLWRPHWFRGRWPPGALIGYSLLLDAMTTMSYHVQDARAGFEVDGLPWRPHC
jgi:hypothetical protein